MQRNKPRRTVPILPFSLCGGSPEGPVTDTPKLDLGEYLPYLVNRLGSAVAQQFAADPLARHNLSIEMWRVMVVLTANGSLRQIDLADLTSIEASTLSRLVTRMVRMGLVTRTRSAESSREVTVKLSAKGNALVARLIPTGREFETAAISGISAEDLAVLKRCLRRMYDNVKTKR
jgi:MarR family transcriptional regulator, organic hydroperoxide resistance regulator